MNAVHTLSNANDSLVMHHSAEALENYQSYNNPTNHRSSSFGWLVLPECTHSHPSIYPSASTDRFRYYLSTLLAWVASRWLFLGMINRSRTGGATGLPERHGPLSEAHWMLCYSRAGCWASLPSPIRKRFQPHHSTHSISVRCVLW